MKRILCIISISGTLAGYQSAALAADPAAPDLTVQPWTDTTFQISEQDKRLALRYHTIRPSGLFLYTTGAVPLDEQTREAAFMKSGRLPAFSARLLLGYDSRAERMKAVAQILKDLQTALAPPDSLPLRAYLEAPSDSETDRKLCRVVTEARQPSLAEECKNPDAWLSRYTCDFLGYPGQTDARACVDRGPQGELGTRCRLPPPHGSSELQPAEVCGALERYLAWRVIRNSAVSSLHELTQKYGIDLILEARRIQGKAPTPAPSAPQKELAEIIADPDLLKKLRERIEQQQKFNLSTFGFVGYDGYEKTTQWALSADLAASLDRQSIYQNDLTNKVDVTTYNVQLGAMASLFLRSATTLMLRTGWDGGVRMSPATIERCTQLPSNDPLISGRACNKAALYLKGDLPGFTHSGYLRFAALQLFPQLRREHIVPGVEVRLGLEGLGDSLRVNGRLAGILTPVIGSTAVRGGIALDVTYEPAAADSGAWTLVPMAFLGATIDQYMGR
jgi:hypothetical protein